MRAGVEPKPELQCMFAWIVPGTCQARATSIPGLRVDLRASLRTFSQSSAITDTFLTQEGSKSRLQTTPSRSDTPSIRSYLLNYNVVLKGQNWWALTIFLALRNHQNLGTQNNNPVLLMIGRILGTVAENTGWLKRPEYLVKYDPLYLVTLQKRH